MIRFVADCWSCIGVNSKINNDLAEKLAIPIEYLNPVVSTVGYVNVVLSIDGKAVWSIKLSWLVTGFSP